MREADRGKLRLSNKLDQDPAKSQLGFGSESFLKFRIQPDSSEKQSSLAKSGRSKKNKNKNIYLKRSYTLTT